MQWQNRSWKSDIFLPWKFQIVGTILNFRGKKIIRVNSVMLLQIFYLNIQLGILYFSPFFQLFFTGPPKKMLKHQPNSTLDILVNTLGTDLYLPLHRSVFSHTLKHEIKKLPFVKVFYSVLIRLVT